jgi:hypothetical protein
LPGRVDARTLEGRHILDMSDAKTLGDAYLNLSEEQYAKLKR